MLSRRGVRRDLLDTLDVHGHGRVGRGGDRRGAAALCSGIAAVVVGRRRLGDHAPAGRPGPARTRPGQRPVGSTLATCLDMLEPHLFDESRAWGQRDLGSELVSQIEALWEVTKVEAGGSSITASRDCARGRGECDSCGPPARPDPGHRTRGCVSPPTASGSWAPTTPHTLTSRNNLAERLPVGRGAWARRSRCTSGPSPTASGSSAPTTPTRWPPATTSPAPTSRRDGSTRRSRCTSGPSPTERILGPDHPDTLTSRNNLAGAYQVGGAPRARRSRCTSGPSPTASGSSGPDHPDTLTSRNNLAGAYQSVGAWRGDPAVRADPHRLRAGPRPRPPRHADLPQQPRRRLQSAGAWARRSRCTSRPSPTTERVLGPDHPDTLTSRNNLAAAYRSAGHLDEAIPLLRADPHRPRAGPRPRPPRHADLPQQPRRRLPVGRGASSEAIPLLRADPHRPRADPGPRPPRHPDHPATTSPAPTSGRALTRRSRCTSETLTDRERVLGPDHPDTLTSRNNLAGAYQRRGVWRRRSPCTSGPSSTRERVLGPDHPDTLASRNNLAAAYQSAGRARRGDHPVRADPHRPRAGPRPRPPRDPDIPQRPRWRLRVGGAAGRGDQPVRAHPHRPRATPRPRPPRHPGLAQQPRWRLRVGGAAGRGDHPHMSAPRDCQVTGHEAIGRLGNG